MSYSIPGSTKILTLATAPFLITLVGALSVYGTRVYMLLWPQERGTFFFLRAQMDTFNCTIIKKI